MIFQYDFFKQTVSFNYHNLVSEMVEIHVFNIPPNSTAL